MAKSLPNCKSPCADCPFRKDSKINSLGGNRMTQILQQESFACHKKHHLQCAGHMLIMKENNLFYRLAKHLEFEFELSGEELVFSSPEECIQSHSR